MRDETTYRGAGFREGRVISLADNQTWVFPPPPEVDDPRHEALVSAITEAEDRSELLLAELALAMNLLSRNYDLGPAEYRTLFGFRPGGPELEQARADFHDLAVEHVGTTHADVSGSHAPAHLVGSGHGRGLLRGSLARVGAWF